MGGRQDAECGFRAVQSNFDQRLGNGASRRASGAGAPGVPSVVTEAAWQKCSPRPHLLPAEDEVNMRSETCGSEQLCHPLGVQPGLAAPGAPSDSVLLPVGDLCQSLHVPLCRHLGLTPGSAELASEAARAVIRPQVWPWRDGDGWD